MSNELTRYEERFAQMAQEYTSVEQTGGDFLSTKGGVLTYQGEPLPGNQTAVIVLDAIHERTFYMHKYDATAEVNPPPVCYAFARTPEEIADMAPHPSMQSAPNYFIPQNDVCVSCKNNEWGTSNTGRGKACSERRRMALLPAGYFTPRRGSRDFDLHLIEDPEHYKQADIAYLKIPVMSVKDWGRYVQQVASQHRRPPLGVITRLYLEPDPKSQFRVKYETVDLLPDTLFDIIMARHEEAKANIMTPYVAPTGDDAPQPVRSARR